MGRGDPTPFIGTWRILTMELWSEDAFDLMGPAHFTFDKDGFGNFRFIAVEGGMDCYFGERDGKPFVEFSWVGKDDNHQTNGRGWAVLEGDVLKGRIFLHQADDSGFTASRSRVVAGEGR